jgi:hypothetical protein
MTSAIPAWWRWIFTRRTPPKALNQEGEIPSFENIFPRAELLLSYAATAGIALNDGDVKLLTAEIGEYKAAERASTGNIGNHDFADILSSYSRVAKQLLPVTAISLCECSVDSR